MATTSATTYASTIQTKYLTKLLMTAQGYLVMDRFANNKMVGKGEGNSVRVNRILRPTKQITVSTAGTLITDGDAKALTSNFKDMDMEIWGDSFSFNEDVEVTSFVSDEDNQKAIAKQMARSLDYQISKKMSTQCLRHRIDNDSTYELSATATTGSTTSMTGAFVTTSDDKNGGYVTITNPDGPNYDITSQITDCTENSSTDTMAVSFPQAITSSSKAHVVVGTGIISTDIMTTTGLLRCAAWHELLETERFDGGIFRCFLDAPQHYDLYLDTTFQNAATYDASERFGSYRLGRWFDIEFLVSSELYREDVDGTENQSTGVVHVSLIFGANSHSVFTFANPGGSGKFGVNWYVVDKPDTKNLRLSKKFLSWKGMYAAGVTRATSVIGLMTGATDLGITN